MATKFGVVAGWDCSETVVYVVELYASRGGRAHGSLDARVYVCPEHLERGREAAWLEGLFTSYVPAGQPIGTYPCGRWVDFREGSMPDVKSTPEASHTDERADKGCTHPADEPCFGKRRPGAPTMDGETPSMTYRLVVNAEECAKGTLQEVGAVVAELTTTRLAAEPDRLADEAMSISMEFGSGTVAQRLDAEGDWYTVFDAYGEQPLRMRVTKE